jgi:hypothetical protein
MRAPAFFFGNLSGAAAFCERETDEGKPMNSIIYMVGLVVIVIAILSFVGLA